ncbi:hypothetical protein PR202_gb22603 [Eleusine coracana subsp. coracana]|uniref:Uncharacterized protein n=1 Tax=Eleusine coracana subsp. coracana TaxID=191504 RepID=A0AAV5FGR8_ELECO|nr:hypothetical protein PR202_gb22603 [Eleusine coracana subsp. coracana]
MDGGGEEALLVRRSKAKKRPAPAAPHADGRESGGGGKFLAFWRDYHDLRQLILQETEAKKRRLENKNRRKLCLLAEIKFLRRKYKSLVKQNLHQTHYKLKVRQIQSPVRINEGLALLDHDAEARVTSTNKNTNLDFNQDSFMNDEGFDYQGSRGHSKLNNFDQDVVDEDTKTTKIKFLVCSRDTRNSPSNDDEGKISWQDRLTLRA